MSLFSGFRGFLPLNPLLRPTGPGRPRGSLGFCSVLCWPHASGLSFCLGPSCRSESSFPGHRARRSQRDVEVRVREVPLVGFPFLVLSASLLGSAESAVFLLFLMLQAGSVSKGVLSSALSARARGVLLRWFARVVLSFLVYLLVRGVSAWVTPAIVTWRSHCLTSRGQG